MKSVCVRLSLAVLSGVLLGAVFGFVWLALVPKAQAQAPAFPCRYGTPTFDGWNTVWSAHLRIRTPCQANGGIQPCTGRVIRRMWMWDALHQAWTIWGPDPWAKDDRQTWCNGTDSYEWECPYTAFPPNALCSLEMEWWRYDATQKKLVYVTTSDWYFWTP